MNDAFSGRTQERTQEIDAPRVSPHVGETTSEVLAALEGSTQVPVLICDSSGRILTGSPNSRTRCAAAGGGGVGLAGGAPGTLQCSITGCPHYLQQASATIRRPAAAETTLHAVHCNGPVQARTSAALLAPALAADAERSTLVDSLSRSYEELHLLQILASSFEEEIDHRLTFQKILNCVRQMLPFTAAEVWSFDAADAEYRCLLHYDGSTVRKSLETIPDDESLASEVRNMGPRVLREAGPNETPLETFLRSFLVDLGNAGVLFPLLSRSRVLGILALGIPPDHASVRSPRLRMLSAAAKQASLVLQVHILVNELRANEGLRREIDIARKIQHNLLPQEIPRHDSFDLFAGCVTAARVGGDYYDFFENTPDQLGMLVADVSGHSVASGLVAMSFRSCFRFFLEEHKLSHQDLFTRVNRSIHRELEPTGHFLSAIYGTLHKEDRTFRYVNAGHHHPLIYNVHSDTFRTLETVGLLIGVLPEWGYEAGEATLDAGDILLLYTDGIVEAENQSGDMFGMARLQDAIRKHFKKSAKQMYHYLLRELYIFQDEQFNKDDVTLMLLKIN